MKTLLFGAQADDLRPEIEKHPELTLVQSRPDVIVCYGGDGTLLSAELRWPGIPKVPIKNSRRGERCIPHPPEAVIARLAHDELCRTEYGKLECAVYQSGHDEAMCYLTAMNEFNLHNGRINAAVRFMLWLDDEPYEDGAEIIGDGFVVCTPFGSTAYYNQITRGVFFEGMGIAFKYTAQHTNHHVIPDHITVRARITRGPAVLAFDNCPDYFNLDQGDELVIRKYVQPAVLFTWAPMSRPSDAF